ncbi:MAG TPA: UDP-N-acetylmuramoyl-L-alanyl-D-glutamate--2,6-diaminopimelate ligase, partial [Acidimicrobiales bacterium]|nr:UDP-N-acetylmuramoyl-L-alanyl-D-glutamate--2,6-diaminopimelate ligase [Acidimicrobiales bacterium]
MLLSRLLEAVKFRSVRGDPATTEIVSVAYHTEGVVPGALFCCVPGDQVDGHEFAPQAVRAGAVALLCQRFVDVDDDVPQIVVDDVRAAMAQAAAALFDHPSHRLAVVGVTGTNGKTTTTHLLRAVLEADGRRAGVIGTLSGARTTPPSPELQCHLAELADAGFDAVAMEVSSHALVQHRVDAVRFRVAVFTNLSQDHLDYHGTMDDYFAAKATLFDPERADVAVVNADDPWGRRLLAAARLPTRPFSLAEAVDLHLDRQGSSFRWEGEPVRLRIPGPANVANALAAAAAARELGVSPAVVAAGLSELVSVPGRNEAVDRGQPFTVLVDYAHTPDGLEQALSGARALAAGGRVVVVFGCGGDRDRAKRPLMGEVATRLADLAVLTSDNPRSEDPAAIIDQVRAGVTRPDVLVVEPDRRAAIALALSAARPGDLVLIAGKGHETTQVIGSESLPFDDRAIAA